MGTLKRISRKLPALWRRIGRRHPFSHVALLGCVVLVLPVGVIAGVRLSRFMATHQALAATRALMPEHSARGEISARERRHYAAALANLVTEDPDKMHELVEQDFLLMLHEPDLKRTEGKVEAWQYRADSCLLDLYFRQGNDGAGPVVHYEVRPRKVATFTTNRAKGQTVDTAACLEALYKQRTI